MHDSGATLGDPKWMDRLFVAVGLLATTCVLLPFLWIIADIVFERSERDRLALLNRSAPRCRTKRRCVPMIVSTIAVLSVTLLAALPIALTTLLRSFIIGQNRVGPFVDSRFLDLLAAVPSIVFGLFGNAFFCVALGMGYSLLAGGLTLACMILPTLTRLIEYSLRTVPDSYREAAAGLGLSDSTTFCECGCQVRCQGSSVRSS